jgi:DNA repair protein RadA/Sms
MSKTRTCYRCTSCGQTEAKWAGRCSACGEWSTLVEEVVVDASGSGRGRGRAGGGAGAVGLAGADTPLPIDEVDSTEWQPAPIGIAEVDRVLGGGLVPGSVTLVGGEPGIGKSTLLLQIVHAAAAAGRRSLYVSAEESKQQVRLRAQRLGTLHRDLWLVSETNLSAIVDHIATVKPELVVVDSVQTIADLDLPSAPGTVVQVRECAHRLVQVAKAQGVAVLLVGHVTKEGALAGPRVLEHVVDTVLSFEGDRHHAFRVMRAVKHRFGATDELGVFEMGDGGLVAVPDPSSVFLADRARGVSGSMVVPTIDGHRPLLVEHQALVNHSTLVMPRRSAEGVDSGRLAFLLAVLSKRVAVDTSKHEVYALAVGGVQVHEPGADLALCCALWSAVHDKPLPDDLVACGEVGLGGELRRVGHLERRLGEAARLGFRRAVVPASAPDLPAGIEILRAGTLADALSLIGTGTGNRRRSTLHR